MAAHVSADFFVCYTESMRQGTFLADVYNGRYDKSVHLAASFLITIAMLAIMPFYAALFFVFAIGLGKEFFDARRPSDRFDIGDLAGNVAGIALAGLAWRLFV